MDLITNFINKKIILLKYIYEKKGFYEQLKNFNFNLRKKFIFKITKNKSQAINQDIVFPLCYKKILPERFLKKIS